MEIEIRHIEKSDITGIKKIYDQPHVVEGTIQLPYQSIDMCESRFEGLKNYIGLVAIKDGQVVGQFGVHTIDNPRRKHVAIIDIAVCSSVQGKGVASVLMKAGIELCDNWLNIEKIELQVFCDNERAMQLYKKHGFKVEGELEKYGYTSGGYVNAYTMGRIKNNKAN